MHEAMPESAEASPVPAQQADRTLICTIVTADTMDGAIQEIKEAARVQADVVELRADYLTEFDAATDIERLLDACSAAGLPAIFTYRPVWEGCPPSPLPPPPTHTPHQNGAPSVDGAGHTNPLCTPICPPRLTPETRRWLCGAAASSRGRRRSA